MTEKIVLITGATAGIGRCTAIELAKLGATIVCACRDMKKGQIVVEEITRETKNKNIHCLELDLSSLKSVKQFVKEFQSKFKKLDVLINNAGIMAVGKKQLTVDKLELQMATNYFCPFFLTNLLIDELKAGEGSRVINISSEAHRFSMLNLDDLNSEKQYDPFVTQGNTKMANILFTQEFANQFKSCNIKAVALHPGSIRTNLEKQTNFVIKILFLLIFPFWWFVTKSPQQGSQTSLYCSLMPFEKLQNGKYYKDCKIASTSYKAINQEEFATKLWVVSKKLVGLTS